MKPENILLRTATGPNGPFEILVADFGIAKLFSPKNQQLSSTGGFIGTPQYAAPEQFMGTTATTASDIYSLSAVLMFCVTGKHMFHYATTLAGCEPDEIWEIKIFFWWHKKGRVWP